jgi:hypothetical protein
MPRLAGIDAELEEASTQTPPAERVVAGRIGVPARRSA